MTDKGAPIRLKDRALKHCVMVGEAGYPPGSGRKPVDTRRLVDACEIEGCPEPATQAHGVPPDLIQTCDAHAEAVMLELISAIVEVPK